MHGVGRRDNDYRGIASKTILRAIRNKLYYREITQALQIRMETYQGSGTINVKIPISVDDYVLTVAQVIAYDIIHLVGLVEMIELKPVQEFNKRCTISKSGRWWVHLVKNFGHVYIQYCSVILFSESELHRLHRDFARANLGKRLPVLKRADSSSLTPEANTAMEIIYQNYDVCRRESTEPRRFRVSLSHGVCITNCAISDDMMNFFGKSILHAVDQVTKFNAPAILQEKSTKKVWYCVIKNGFSYTTIFRTYLPMIKAQNLPVRIREVYCNYTESAKSH